MDAQTMKTTLEQKAQELSSELIQMEKDFNTKKEQFLKIQGALEALYELERDESSNSAE
jgi:hypothetical protein